MYVYKNINIYVLAELMNKRGLSLRRANIFFHLPLVLYLLTTRVPALSSKAISLSM